MRILVTGGAGADMSGRMARAQGGLHVLFLNAHDGLGADVAVHVMLARKLDRRKIRVSAATTPPETPGASACEAFAAIAELTHVRLGLGRNVGGRRGIGRVTALLDNVRGGVNLVRLAWWCRRNRVDVVHVTERPRQALFGLLLARMAGCACLIHAHTSLYPQDATRTALLKLRLADAVVGVSQFTAGTFERVAQLPGDRVFAVHNAVDGRVFCPEAAEVGRAAMRQRLGVPTDAPVIGCVARLMRWKGQERLLQSFAVVRQTRPNARLVLAGLSADSSPDGQGDFRDYLIRRAHALGLASAVVLPGFLPQDEMPHFYGALDVLAHPSLEEPFGLAVVEAMASSKPVVAIGSGGIPEIIRNGTDGLLVPPDDSKAMAEAILRVLHNRELAEQLAHAGRQRVLERFTPERQARSMLHVYQQIVTRRAAQGRSAPVTGVAQQAIPTDAACPKA